MSRMRAALHWRLRLADRAVRWRFKRHAHRPINVAWVRHRLGHPLWMRRLITPAVRRRRGDREHFGFEMLAPPADHAAPRRVLLYVHGGGYIACSPDTHRPLTARLAREWNALVVVPAYRLAPEHPFPAGRDDVLALWRWMLQALHLSPAQVAFVGDSAGGGLALSAALGCAAAGLPAPGAIVGFSPWTDLACSGASIAENAQLCSMFVPSQLELVSRMYAGGVARDDPQLSPFHADLSGLPPLCLHAGAHELLRDDSVRFAERARAAGVDVSVRTWPGVPHAWQFLAGFLPEARESLDLAGSFVRAHVPDGDLDRAMHCFDALPAGPETA